MDELLNPAGPNSKWENVASVVTPGVDQQANYQGSWASFWKANSADGLTNLVGSWGVDPVNDQAWVVLPSGGAGVYAVVPEPGTFSLLSVAGIGFGMIMVRRRSKVGGQTRLPRKRPRRWLAGMTGA